VTPFLLFSPLFFSEMNMRPWLVLLCVVMIMFSIQVGCKKEESDTDTDAVNNTDGQSATRTGEDMRGTSQEDSQARLQECADKMHLTFPPSTRLLGFHKVTGGPDDYIFLKIVLPRADLAPLLKKSPFEGIGMRDDWRYMIPQRGLQWWDVEAPTRFQSQQVTLPGPCGLRILINQDHKEVVIVYLEWFET
jgi:hypothetical protein